MEKTQKKISALLTASNDGISQLIWKLENHTSVLTVAKGLKDNFSSSHHFQHGGQMWSYLIWKRDALRIVVVS